MRLLQVLVPQVEKICIDKYVAAVALFPHIGQFASFLFLPFQGPDRRIGNFEILAAWHFGRSTTSSAPNFDSKISGKQRNNSMVPHLYVGCDILEVC